MRRYKTDLKAVKGTQTTRNMSSNSVRLLHKNK